MFIPIFTDLNVFVYSIQANKDCQLKPLQLLSIAKWMIQWSLGSWEKRVYSSSFRPSPVDKFRLGSLPESWRLRDLGVWISQDIININKNANHDSVPLKQIVYLACPTKRVVFSSHWTSKTVSFAREKKASSQSRCGDFSTCWLQRHKWIYSSQCVKSLAIVHLVGGWTNPFEKYESKWEASPSRGENKNIWNHHLVTISESYS